MSLANDSVKITPGSGATIATHSPGSGSTEYQVITMADSTGHLVETKPTYLLSIPGIDNTSANRFHWELFNGSSATTITVRAVYPVPRTDTAATGTVSTRFDFYRTTAWGSGGTAHNFESSSTLSANFSRLDTNDSSIVGSGISCLTVLASITTGAWLFTSYVFPEETNPAAILIQGINLIPQRTWGKELVLRPSQGLAVKQGTVASVNQTGWLIAFTTE
jgi:hypothetical protein